MIKQNDISDAINDNHLDESFELIEKIDDF